MKLTTLLHQYSLNSDFQYFEMILTSYDNGQRKQAENQFCELSKQDRKNFIKWVVTALEVMPLSQNDFSNLIDKL